MTTPDQDVRQRALDPLASFCVTAPAGSGKTELLTQRLLTLLARVQRPEQVLAITFTRKAAAEMRERIVRSLHLAREGTPVTSAHEQLTRELADAVLGHAVDRQWPVDDPNIFNVRTIDSLCHYLTRQMPLLSGLGGSVAPVDDAMPLYEAAVDSLFQEGLSQPDTAAALTPLLLSFDNRWEPLRALLVGLLQRRGDWAHRSLTGDPEAAERTLRTTVGELITDVLEALIATLGRDNLAALTAMAVGANDALRAAHADGSAGPRTLQPCSVRLELAPTTEALEAWRWLLKLLLTNDARRPGFRKRLDKNLGFPPDAKDRKQSAEALIEALQVTPALLPLLVELRALPDISEEDTSWQLVLHLAHLLPRLEAHLLLEFSRRGEVDHTHVALAAEMALGSDEAPTDLAMRLDYQLEHILVDEFQDTSDSQFRLLEKLTRDWASHNATGASPRTVFVVGDGMQSIYRFRHANVGLFIEARERGISGLRLESLALTSNFRSQQSLVEWVNQSFATLFPERDDPARGQIRHALAAPVKPSLPGAPVAMHVFCKSGGTLEANWVTDQIAALRAAEPNASIAVLGRGRRHLAALLASLKAAGIPVMGRDLEPLADKPVIMDLMALCRWLANPADSIAATALLRAPCCGLTIADLTALLADWPQPCPLLPALAEAPGRLSEDGIARAGRLLAALNWGESTRDRLATSVWVEHIWLRMLGPAVLDERDWSDARQFFALLADAEQHGSGLDIASLERMLAGRYVDHTPDGNPVELLTIHKSKGLQYDYVFMPALASGVRGNDRDLLRWHWHQSDTSRELLIAADDGSELGEPTLYQYLAWLDRSKSEAELRRLLYVGVTRARNRVWLTGEVQDPESWTSARRGQSLLAVLAGAGDMEPTVHAALPPEDAIETVPQLTRIAGVPTAIEPSPPSVSGVRPDLPAATSNRVERAYGTALHRGLELLAGLDPLPHAHHEGVARAVDLVLRQHLPASAERGSQAMRVLEDIDRCLSDEAGRWLLGCHPGAASELSVMLQTEEGGARELIVDRTFIDEEGLRWIIDYKSSGPGPGQSLDEFLAHEVTRYSEQLKGYAEVLVKLDEQEAVATRGVRCALYFPRLAHLEPVTW